jgi:hypothetical protein
MGRRLLLSLGLCLAACGGDGSDGTPRVWECECWVEVAGTTTEATGEICSDADPTQSMIDDFCSQVQTSGPALMGCGCDACDKTVTECEP